ncbi:MAG TPA: PE-PPE domain-containing protein, partial [Mycobacterium sp.]|nr:PE-PPE domain-containing protein [Mycobacterium sp.]
MTSLLTQPELITTAAANVADIRSAISAAKSAAAGPTTGVVAAAADEVSAAAAKLFGAYAQEYQSVLAQAGVFHEEFAAALASAGSAYAAAEAANASAISGALVQLTAPVRSLFGATPALLGGDSPTPTVTLQGTTIGLVMGGSGNPIPSPSFVTRALNYVNQNFSVLPSNAHALFTPEGYYPLTGIKVLTIDASVAQGVQILDSAIKQQLAASPSGSVAVFGVSQSADISSLEMQNLANPMLNPNPPTANQLGFTLLGNQMNPNGGILARFPGFPTGTNLSLPSLGITFYGATPSNTIYPTHIYTLEYDGYADFPQYPINFISDLNAFAGIAFVHGTYLNLNPSALPPGYAIQTLPTSPGYTGVTTYSMITTPNGLPLLEPVRAIPVIGTPIADLLQPDLTTIVNLGYGNPNFGWSQGPADVHTYFGLFPHVSQALIAQDLITGTHQGAAAFMSDIHAEAAGVSASSVSHSLTSMAGTGAADLSALTSALSTPDSIIETI